MTTEYRDALGYPGFTDGLDLSQVQMVTDAAAVVAAGFRWACVKASEGVGYCDPAALRLLDQLRGAGLICNVYSFLRPSQGRPAEQVEKAFACAGDEFPMRLALDLEGAPDGMPPGELVAFAEACVDACLEQGALAPELYTYPWFYKSRMLPAAASSAKLALCPLWMAEYGSNTAPTVPHRGHAPYTPPPWRTWTKHQYSGDGGYLVRGVAGAVDRNLYNGTIEDYRLYMGLPEHRADEPQPIVHPMPGVDPGQRDPDPAA